MPRKDAIANPIVYTPDELADEAVALLLKHSPPDATILDPCCGDGQLLAACRRAGVGFARLRGYDIDSQGVAAAAERAVARVSVEDLFEVGQRIVPERCAVICNPPPMLARQNSTHY